MLHNIHFFLGKHNVELILPQFQIDLFAVQDLFELYKFLLRKILEQKFDDIFNDILVLFALSIELWKESN